LIFATELLQARTTVSETIELSPSLYIHAVYNTYAARTRVAASALAVTSCFANTLFITMLTPSTSTYTSPVCVSVWSH